jgi:formylglycine-generating enzyme required for sulfatase activity
MTSSDTNNAAAAGTTGWDVFISYTRADALAQAEALHKALASAGLRVFKDDRALRPGQRWFGEIEDALASCRHFVVLLGRAGLDRWVGAETQVALSRHFSATPAATQSGQRLTILPVLLEGTPPQLMRTFLAQFQSLGWPAEQGEPPAELVAALAAQPANAAGKPLVEGCPYRGLGAFQKDDAQLFFGRERDLVALLGRLGEVDPPRPGDAHAMAQPRRQLRWLSIVGGSGTGKSSLLRAGLLPLVDAGALAARTGVERWAVAGPILPGADPVLELAKALSAAFDPPERRDSAALLDRLRRSDSPDADQALALWLSDRLADDPSRAVLLVVDQFEELFTLATPESRLRFDALLATALQASDATGRGNRLYLATTCRSDLAHRLPEDLPQLAQQLNTLSLPYVLAPMGLPELRRAIERPAALAGLDVSELVAALLQDAREDLAGALPLVQHALTTLWAVRDMGPSLGSATADGHIHPGGRLTLKSFDDAGRLAGILAREADGVLARIEQHRPAAPAGAKPLGAAGRHGAMELLLSLSHYQADGRHTRQHLELDAALRVAGQGDTPAALATGRQVLDLLAGQRAQGNDSGGLRLVSIDTGGRAEASDSANSSATPTTAKASATANASSATAPRVDLIHEALLRSRDGQPYWPTLVDYLTRHKDRDLQRQNLRRAAEHWAEAKDRWGRWTHAASRHEQRHWAPLLHAASAQERAYMQGSRTPARLKLAATVVGSVMAAVGLAWALVISNLDQIERHLQANRDQRDALNTLRWALFPPALPRVVEVPLGRYTMGCLPGRDDVLGIKCQDDEAPREVDLTTMPAPCTAYGTFEVSFDEYDYYVWSLRRQAGKGGPDYPVVPSSSRGHRGQRPVVDVSALDAEQYAAWLTAQSKGSADTREWRLPTEEEWEFIARSDHPSKPGGLPGPYWWGKTTPAAAGSAPARANCGSGCDREVQGQSAPIGHYQANAFGLHDTVGNVWEWTSSIDSTGNQPAKGQQGSAEALARVLRGGSWLSNAQNARASFRLNYPPDYRYIFIGFRVCRASPIGPLDHGAAGR